MASFNKFQITVQNLANGAHNLSTDVLKVALSNSAPVSTNQVFGDISEISAGHGYSAGGTTVGITSSTESGGTYKLIASANTVFTASGGSIGPFRYIVFYDSTPTSPLKPLLGWWDYGSSITLNDTDTFTVQYDGTNGIIQMS
jgi:hypothetical protein